MSSYRWVIFTNMNPAPPVIMMFCTSCNGSNFVDPLKTGESFHSMPGWVCCETAGIKPFVAILVQQTWQSIKIGLFILLNGSFWSSKGPHFAPCVIAEDRNVEVIRDTQYVAFTIMKQPTLRSLKVFET